MKASKIDIRKDSLQMALIRKSNNKKLSSKTLNKLACIVQSTMQMPKKDALYFFKKGSRIQEKSILKSMTRQLENSQYSMRSDYMILKVSRWLENCHYSHPLR